MEDNLKKIMQPKTAPVKLVCYNMSVLVGYLIKIQRRGGLNITLLVTLDSILYFKTYYRHVTRGLNHLSG
jgi:hypothetical protein